MTLGAATGFDDDLAEMVADLPSTLKWAGREYTGTASEVSNSKRVMGEGMEEVFDLQWVGDRDQFTTAPKAGAVASVDGVAYRITRVETSQDSVAYNLYLAAI